jgi:hypothetical protein
MTDKSQAIRLWILLQIFIYRPIFAPRADHPQHHIRIVVVLAPISQADDAKQLCNVRMPQCVPHSNFISQPLEIAAWASPQLLGQGEDLPSRDQ